MISLENGKRLVRISRHIAEKIIKDNNEDKVQRSEIKKYIERTNNKDLNEKHGVFVTIKNFKTNLLRGCIGFISPSPLWETVQCAACLAAFGDPRFSRLTKDELYDVVFEVSVMSEPMLVSGKTLGDRKKKIKIGRDGLIIINGMYNGLLLPQVAVKHNMSVDDFLVSLCHKANLTKEFLEDENTKLLKFQCQIFEEQKPNGKITEIKIF